VVDIDLLSSFNASRAAFEQLKETKGALIYISAGMAYMPHAFQVHVGAAKAAINMMMKNLALKGGPLWHSHQQHRTRPHRRH
jgi:NAD(P)-dependent dehydrogenase (short-subunit alcohol dehydrogenase family)